MARTRARGPSFLVIVSLAYTVGAILSSCAGEAPCEYNSDCFQSYCDNGVCKKACVDAELDCPHGYICNQVAQCEAPFDGGVVPEGGRAPETGAHETGASHPETGTSHDGGIQPHDTGVDVAVPHDSGQDVALKEAEAGASKTELDLCSSDAECKTGLCTAMYVGGQTRCTRGCSSNSDCMTNTRCVTIGANQLCVMSDIGRSCTTAASCNFACLTSQQYCTMPCTTGSDCPNGYGCEPVGDPAQNVCVKAEATCSSTDTSSCIASAACDMTILVSGCTLACNTASDCPQRAAGFAPWTCNGLCVRPPDVYGPLPQGSTPAQYACNGSGTVVNLCNDAQHIDFTAFDIPPPPTVDCSSATTTAGIATDSCVDSCLYQGTCIHGYACVALGSVSNGTARIGLCLPALGGGEIGASCANDSECFFGYCSATTSLCTRDCSADGLCTTGSTCVVDGNIPVEGMPFKRCQ
jgi:hypothetical protein